MSSFYQEKKYLTLGYELSYKYLREKGGFLVTLAIKDKYANIGWNFEAL